MRSTVIIILLTLAPPLVRHQQPVFSQEMPEVGRAGLFAFCHDTHDSRKRDFSAQAAMLKQLGYDGAGHVGLDGIDQRLRSLDAAGLELYLAGVTIHLTKDVDAQLKPVRDALPALEDRQLILYTVVTGLPPGSPEGNEAAISAVRRLCDLVEPAGVRVAIYPHTGDWVATVAQAVALAKRVKRSNCGLVFNLCHFLRNERPDSLDTVLREAAPYLMAVTINGADLAGVGDKDWKRLIQPLDAGNFDLTSLLGILAAHDYRGPIGIMCYGIEGDARTHLSRSIRKWRELIGRRGGWRWPPRCTSTTSQTTRHAQVMAIRGGPPSGFNSPRCGSAARSKRGGMLQPS